MFEPPVSPPLRRSPPRVKVTVSLFRPRRTHCRSLGRPREPRSPREGSFETEREKRLASGDRHDGSQDESVALLAGCVAHEISGPLTYVRWDVEALARLIGELRVLAEAPDEGGRAGLPGGTSRARAMLGGLPELLEHMYAGLDRLQQLSADLAALAHVEQPETLLDIREVVQAALRLARPHLARQASLRVDIGDAPLVVFGRRSVLIRIVLGITFERARRADDEDQPAGLEIGCRQDGEGVVITWTADQGGNAWVAVEGLAPLVARQGGSLTVNSDANQVRVVIRMPRAS